MLITKINIYLETADEGTIIYKNLVHANEIKKKEIVKHEFLKDIFDGYYTNNETPVLGTGLSYYINNETPVLGTGFIGISEGVFIEIDIEEFGENTTCFAHANIDVIERYIKKAIKQRQKEKSYKLKISK